MKVTFAGAGPQTLPSHSLNPTDPGSQWQQHQWHLYISGTWSTSTSATLQVQYSPDAAFVADGAKRWFQPASLLLSGTGAVPLVGADVWFNARFRSIQFVLTGGDAGTSLTVEVV